MVKDYNGENFKLWCDTTKNGEAVKCWNGEIVTVKWWNYDVVP